MSFLAPEPSFASLKRRLETDPLRLLVSVRDDEEALVAFAGGTDVIDVKEPARGALGRADDETLRRIAETIEGRAILSFAGGEAIDLASSSMPDGQEREEKPRGYALFKYGPAGLADVPSWRDVLLQAWRQAPPGASPIAVAYVDYRDARAPAPEEIVELAIAHGCAGVLFDTFGKVPRLGLTALSRERLMDCIAMTREAGLIVSLAGSLGAEDVTEVRRLGADLIAVRGAVCSNGRESRIESDRVIALRRAIADDARACSDFDAERNSACQRGHA